jgi:hypothetical protein
MKSSIANRATSRSCLPATMRGSLAMSLRSSLIFKGWLITRSHCESAWPNHSIERGRATSVLALRACLEKRGGGIAKGLESRL